MQKGLEPRDSERVRRLGLSKFEKAGCFKKRDTLAIAKSQAGNIKCTVCNLTTLRPPRNGGTTRDPCQHGSSEYKAEGEIPEAGS